MVQTLFFWTLRIIKSLKFFTAIVFNPHHAKIINELKQSIPAKNIEFSYISMGHLYCRYYIKLLSNSRTTNYSITFLL